MIRVGIDVGGTFTDVIAVDAATRRLIASVKVPTTHDAPQGVAAGIVDGLERLLREHAIDPRAIAFLAHSTTQATNALLEGDLAAVGVVCIANGPAMTRWFPFRAMRFPKIGLDGGAAFEAQFVAANDTSDSGIDAALDTLQARGVHAIAATEAFSVDRPQRESRVIARAKSRGLAATGGAEVATSYGLRARTRTAALNAAILPRMLESARTTARAAAAAGVAAPLMIMRSDGGVMDVAEVERRPILTLLSGPAAGVAGALFHENVTDGIFIEVGGTSADCSAIRGGMPQMRPARIGGRRTLLRTLDVRTLAIAGGSLVTLDGARVRDVGPRSAHIAGARYASFTPLATIEGGRFDPHDGYAMIVAHNGSRIAITPTCAANVLGIVPSEAFAFGDLDAAMAAFSIVADAIGSDVEQLARGILDVATSKLRDAVDELIADYALERATIAIVGGGGGAAALVPYAAKAFGLPFRLARNAEVISPLGVALALVRDVVERTIVDPTPSDIVRVRREAIEAAIASGAAPDRVEVTVEIERATNLVRATASGATALVESVDAPPASGDERLASAARALRAPSASIVIAATCGEFIIARAATNDVLCVVDARAIVRLVARDATLRLVTVATLERELPAAVEEMTTFGDVGRALPGVTLAYGSRIAEFTGLDSAASVVALAQTELAGLDAERPVAVVISRTAA